MLQNLPEEILASILPHLGGPIFLVRVPINFGLLSSGPKGIPVWTRVSRRLSYLGKDNAVLHQLCARAGMEPALRSSKHTVRDWRSELTQIHASNQQAACQRTRRGGAGVMLRGWRKLFLVICLCLVLYNGFEVRNQEVRLSEYRPVEAYIDHCALLEVKDEDVEALEEQELSYRPSITYHYRDEGGFLHTNQSVIWPTPVFDGSVSSKEEGQAILEKTLWYHDAKSGQNVTGCPPWFALGQALDGKGEAHPLVRGHAWVKGGDSYLLRQALFVPYAWTLSGLAGLLCIVVAGVHSLSRTSIISPGEAVVPVYHEQVHSTTSFPPPFPSSPLSSLWLRSIHPLTGL